MANSENKGKLFVTLFAYTPVPKIGKYWVINLAHAATGNLLLLLGRYVKADSESKRSSLRD
jgi:hypothetical protein